MVAEASSTATKTSGLAAYVTRTTWLASYGLFFSGLALILFSVIAAEILQWPTWLTAFLRDIGLLLSAVMAGTILHEKLLREEMMQEVGAELEQKLTLHVPQVETISTFTAREVHQLFCDRPPGMTGIRLLNDVRRSYFGYYDWVNEQGPQELFFAGRSVLHRIDADIRARTRGPGIGRENGAAAEDILFRRLKESSKIKILFLDPRTNILERLAIEEGQTLEAMVGDIATSVGICRRLYDLLLANFENLQPGSELTIRVYDRIPYFAYHKQDDNVIVGFYFLSTKGSSSAAYELVDDETKQVFGDHFVGILSGSATSTIVEFDGARGRPTFNKQLYEQLHTRFVTILGEERTTQLLERK